MREEGRSPRRAVDRSRRSGVQVLAGGLAASCLIHAVLLAVVAFPRPDLRARASAFRGFRYVFLPPSVEVPPSPEPIERPPDPEIVAVRVEEPVRPEGEEAAGTTPDPIPEPPRVQVTTASDRPSLIPHDVAPMLEGAEHFRRRLERSYPIRLREEGVEGVVELRFFVDVRGRVSDVAVAESSGHPQLDRAAREVADEMQFLPALNRDRAVGVWVSQKICFVTVDNLRERPSLAECGRRLARGS